jgi:DNA-binding transcriptional LysR family regulator
VSHHLSRLEAATGVKLVQRVGRGIRLTPEGELLANRATEIVGRVDAATSELAAQVGLPGLALRAHRLADVQTTEIPDFPRQIYAVTYADPPDPPPPPRR